MMAAIQYYDNEGKEITKVDIRKAVSEGRAILVWSHGNWVNQASLAIYADSDEANLAYDKFETRGQCYSMADETWTEWPTVAEAIKAAAGALRVS
jgi:hypothetical protein